MTACEHAVRALVLLSVGAHTLQLFPLPVFVAALPLGVASTESEQQHGQKPKTPLPNRSPAQKRRHVL